MGYIRLHGLMFATWVGGIGQVGLHWALLVHTKDGSFSCPQNDMIIQVIYYFICLKTQISLLTGSVTQ
jgi:hypothetical protein